VYNISYLERTGDFQRGPQSNEGVKDPQPSRHYHRPGKYRVRGKVYNITYLERTGDFQRGPQPNGGVKDPSLHVTITDQVNIEWVTGSQNNRRGGMSS